MKNDRLFELLCNLDESFIEEAESVIAIKNEKKNRHLPVKILAACLCLALILTVVIPSLQKLFTSSAQDEFKILKNYETSQTPKYYGDPTLGDSVSSNNTELKEKRSPSATMTVRLIETLPNIYTFYDCPKIKYMILKMEVIEVLCGNNIPKEFYYLIPELCFTEFSIYDCFVITNVVQYGSDYSVMYNISKDCPERFDIILLGSDGITLTRNGGAGNIVAFDKNGNFDPRLYESTEGFSSGSGWHNKNSRERIKNENSTLEITKNRILKYIQNGYMFNDFYVHTFLDFSQESQKALEYIKNPENGLYAQTTKGYHIYNENKSVQFRRYIGGFATNETITIYPDKVEYSKASFNEEDLKTLPDLDDAFPTICKEFEAGNINPPHIKYYKRMNNTVNGIFPWYAKTDKGIIGIINISWTYTDFYHNNIYEDDIYYIIEPESKTCQSIDNHSLIKIFGEYETTYIYSGEYNNQGKIIDKSNFYTLE